MSGIANLVAGIPYLSSIGIFLCGAALLYLVVNRTLKRRQEENQ